MREGKLAPSQNVELRDIEDKEALGAAPKKTGPIRFFQKKWAFAAAGVLTVMIVAFVFVRLQGPGEKTELLRGYDDVSILVLFPVGEVTTLSELRWKPVTGVDSYEVKIYTEGGDLVWEGSATDTKIVLPNSINETLMRGCTYLWQVEAVTDRGDRLKSQVVQFKIGK